MATYQILPNYTCSADPGHRIIDLFQDESWLSESQRALLRVARDFRRELGTVSSVPTICIFGYGLKTIADATRANKTQSLQKRYDRRATRKGSRRRKPTLV